VLRPLGTLDPWSVSQKSLRKRLFWRVTGKRMLRAAAAVHHTTEAEKLSTEGLFGLNHGKVIPLGIRQSSSCVCSSEQLARDFPVLADGRYLLALSRLHPKKGLDVLLDAFDLLTSQEQFANWRLVIAGDGPVEYVSQLKQKTESTSLRDRVVFTGWLHGDTRDAVLEGASLVVQPSHQENFGLSVMEALGRSVPVLVSPHVNVAAEIAAANAGWIAAVETEALATRLSEALADEAELERRGRAGKELSLKYSWESSAKALLKLYREISPK
jgi:glycosyltransferase involved in cell wall biosynthesis